MVEKKGSKQTLLLLRNGISGVSESNQKTVTRSDVPEEQPALTCQTAMAAKDPSLSCEMQHLALPLNILTPPGNPPLALHGAHAACAHPCWLLLWSTSPAGCTEAMGTTWNDGKLIADH